MIVAGRPKRIRVMFTPFRDGLQSAFGGKVRVKDILPAMQASAAAGIRHFESGGGARFQAPYFYVGEDPYQCMDEMRGAVGPGAELQILTRSVAGLTLTSQRVKTLDLQARLMKKHGTTWDRNFDFMNDVDSLVKSGQTIVDAGMHHQVCIAMMGLPFESKDAHTAEFYVDIARRLLARHLRIDSVCLKDASGTTDPSTVYETARGIRTLLPPETLLWMHTHDTASTAVACYMAGIAGGCDGIDLSIRPLASGTVQPDVRSMAHALKGTGYSLDIDVDRLHDVEGLLDEGLKDYDFNPVTTTPDARVVGFPMPGGAIGPNVHMMAEAGILHRYSEVLAEFPVVVRAGGAWTSVTPGSQQYWLQAFNNVLYGRWKTIDAGYGRSVLGYFGKTPLPPDPEVVKIASQQLTLEPFDGDPLEAAPDSVAMAEAALRERGLPATEENIFLVAAAVVPGKAMDLNEGIRFLGGRAKINLPLKRRETLASVATAPVPVSSAPPAPVPVGLVSTVCRVEEGGVTRTFRITLESLHAGAAPAVQPAAPAAAAATAVPAAPRSAPVPVYSPFGGTVELAEITVRVGDVVREGDVVAMVEAMKAKHGVRAPTAGTVASIDAEVGADLVAGRPILTIAP
jgi:pyruvate carboxylase subunit B